MHVETMQLDPRIAAIHYKDYRKKVREHKVLRQKELERRAHDAGKELGRVRIERTLMEKEDTILMESYRAMAKGMRILNLSAVMSAAGFDKVKKLPVLAIAGANWEHCHLRHQRERIVFSKTSWPDWDYGRGRFKGPCVAFPQDVFAAEITNFEWRKTNNLPRVDQQQALVPAIPAHLRPSGDLSQYFILWEARWEQRAPADPLLLKHVAGNMYSVLAQWDLTLIEQAVLEGRIG